MATCVRRRGYCRWKRNATWKVVWAAGLGYDPLFWYTADPTAEILPCHDQGGFVSLQSWIGGCVPEPTGGLHKYAKYDGGRGTAAHLPPPPPVPTLLVVTEGSDLDLRTINSPAQFLSSWFSQTQLLLPSENFLIYRSIVALNEDLLK